MRDGLSLLDQCASATVGELTADRVYACLGIAGERKAAELMGYIAAHDTTNALALLNKLYSDGKEMGALLDELACLARDLLILKTAPDAGLTMLSGVATDREAAALTGSLSSGELVAMVEQLEATMSGFVRSASRRVDAELCLIRLCQPELQLDARSLNARLSRMEEQLKSGAFVLSAQPAQTVTEETEKEERPPMPGDEDAPPEERPAFAPARPQENDTPVGFWAELVAALKGEVKPGLRGFLTTGENAQIKGIVRGNQVVLQCQNEFVLGMVNTQDVLQLVARKASAILGRNVTARAEDTSASGQPGAGMERLMSFGRENPGIVTIKDN